MIRDVDFLSIGVLSNYINFAKNDPFLTNPSDNKMNRHDKFEVVEISQQMVETIREW